MSLRAEVARLVKAPVLLLTLRINLNPVPASRPRVTRWGTYYGKRYTAWRNAAYITVPSGRLNWAGPVFVIAEHVVQRPKTTKLAFPNPDVDNFAKATLDLLTKQGGYWNDDRQVVSLVATKRWTRQDEQSHTLVELYEHPGPDQ